MSTGTPAAIPQTRAPGPGRWRRGSGTSWPLLHLWLVWGVALGIALPPAPAEAAAVAPEPDAPARVKKPKKKKMKQRAAAHRPGPDDDRQDRNAEETPAASEAPSAPLRRSARPPTQNFTSPADPEAIEAGGPGGAGTALSLPSADDGLTGGAAPPEAPSTPASRLTEELTARIENGGWARTGATVLWDGDGARQTRSSVLHHRLVATQQLLLKLHVGFGGSTEGVFSGLFEHRFGELDAPDGQTFTGFNGTADRPDFQSVLREAYLGFFWETVDLRVGQQRTPWGRADFFAVNDVLDPRDLRDPVVSEVELLRLPTPSVRLDTLLGPGSLQLVVAPFFRPDEQDVAGSNWARVQRDAPALLRVLLNTPGVESGFEPIRPRHDLTGAAGGARYSWTVDDVDLSTYYHYGYNGSPFIRYNPKLEPLLTALDEAAASNPAVLQQLAQGLGTSAAVDARFKRRHHLGADLQTTAGPLALRLDAAYQSQAVFYRRTLAGTLHPTFQTVLGAEYTTGDIGEVVLVELSYLHLFDAPPTDLLGARADTVAVASMVRWRLYQEGPYELGFELRGVVGIEPGSYLLRPQLAFKYDMLSLRLGALALGGEAGTLDDYYRHNSGIIAQAKYSF